ncbi:MAG: dihydropteroate synthase [Vicingaceae bacterium]
MKNLQLHIKGHKQELRVPAVMGIVNLTPDSFYDGGKLNSVKAVLKKVDTMLSEGADLIDLGAYSSRPGATEVSEEQEWCRIEKYLPHLVLEFPDALFSIDTFRSTIAKKAVEAGISIVNDISGGNLDNKMLDTVAELKVPLILMHMKGKPADMQNDPRYENVVEEVKSFLQKKASLAKDKGIKNVILDPGFGFGKSLEHNYELLRNLRSLKSLHNPIMVGLSRKSMVNKVLGTKAENALNGSTVLHALALLNGADILRVHDVKEAIEVVKIASYFQKD